MTEISASFFNLQTYELLDVTSCNLHFYFNNLKIKILARKNVNKCFDWVMIDLLTGLYLQSGWLLPP